jgi:glycosyltransferase involved in cell wall biosynthesis
MKILFIIPSYEPAWGFGGTVTATVNLCKELVKKGHDVTVFTLNADADGSFLNVETNKEQIRDGVKVWYFSCNILPKKSFYSSNLIKKLKNSIKEFDIVNMSAIWQFLGYKAYKICKKNNIPYIVTPHSSLMKHAFYNIGNQVIKQLYWNLFGKKVVFNAIALHYLSYGEYEESKDIANNNNFFIVPNGIDIDKYKINENKKNDIRKKYNIKNDEILLLYLGRIHSKKNIDLILKSLPVLLENNIEFKFMIVGNIEEKLYYNDLLNIIRNLKLKEYVIWIGAVKNNEVKYYYSSSDLMVLPSKIEGVSMALTEAMANALPLFISNRVANYKEIEKDNCGIVVEPILNDVKYKLLECLKNKEKLRLLGKNALISVKGRYSIDKVVKNMIKEYEKIVKNQK